MTIVRNAFEATKGEGTLTLATHHDAEANQVVLSIEDDGPGIPDERLKTLFDVGLRQKDSRIAAGFGLPTAHSVVLRHGGQLSVGEPTWRRYDVHDSPVGPLRTRTPKEPAPKPTGKTAASAFHAPRADHE